MKQLLLFLLVCYAFGVRGQVITTVAGCGTVGCPIGDGGPATGAATNADNGGAFDKFGNFYFTEILGCRVLKVTPGGIISTVAGTGSCGYSGDGDFATVAKLNTPTAVILDSLGNIYIDDGNNFRIRKVDIVSGKISTIAGTGIGGYNGDGIPATDAQIWLVEDMCFDKLGNIYLADHYNYRIRKINSSGIISTIAGNGVFSSTGIGDNGPATSAGFNLIYGITCDTYGNIYVSDRNCGRVRKVDLAGRINTIAGNGNFTYGGDGNLATNSQIVPGRLTFDNNGNLIIGDVYNLKIFKIDDNGKMRTLAGNGMTGYNGDGEPATAASIDYPAGITYDTCGNLFISESSNKRVRKVTFNPPPCSYLVVKDDFEPNIILVYPNPGTSEVNINNLKSTTQYHLYNMLGATLMQGTLKPGNNTLPLKALQPGIYMLALIDQDGQKTVHKIVKQ